MAQTCPRCSRTNPREAVYCYFDGHLLGMAPANGASVNIAARAFTTPLVFPSGATCRNFVELARACRDNPAAALDLLRKGLLESFLGSQGRMDLASAAREAARAPDRERGLDDFLGKLPGDTLRPARLRVEPGELDLGTVRVGDDRRLLVRLCNDGDRLLNGTASRGDTDWLALGDHPGVASKLFQINREAAMVVHVRGRSLRASPKAQVAAITFESNGGTVAVQVRVTVPVRPFPEGVLAGATTPRQLAEKAKAAPKEAAVLIQNGAVARWYESNGWKYPVRGPTAAGLGAVQQLFEALGLVTPPKVEIATRALDFQGGPGERLEQEVTVFTEEKRAVVAYATCDQQWLQVGRTRFNGRTASIPLIVPAVPDEPGTTLRCKVTVRANGNQRFVVPVSLSIHDGQPVYYLPEPRAETGVPADPEYATAPTVLQGVELVAAEPAYPEVAAGPVYLPPEPEVAPAPAPLPEYEPPYEPPPYEPPVYPRERSRRWLRLAPLGVLGLVLLIAAVHDLVSGAGDDRLLDTEPRLKVQFHKSDAGNRFGLVLSSEQEGKDSQQPRRITVSPFGQTNNTCVRVDGRQLLFGADGGRWDDPRQEVFGARNLGVRSSWVETAKRVRFTQEVEIVQGLQSRLLDTCLVRYRIRNDDTAPHQVGLRVMLNTFLGSREGGPFTVPGDSALCAGDRDLAGAEVPDFLQALENPDLKNPGTVVQLGLRLGGKLEAPSRMTLGAWPDPSLRQKANAHGARAQLTEWEVPVVSMNLLDPPNAAVVLYWNDAPLKEHEVREVGFTFGLGTLAAGEGKDQLAVTAGGSFVPGRELTVFAYVREPAADQALGLELPEGLSLAAGTKQTQEVPPPAKEAKGISPVTWRVKAATEGRYVVKVVSSTGVSREQKIVIKKRPLFD
jgi:hypothetical protein